MEINFRVNESEKAPEWFVSIFGQIQLRDSDPYSGFCLNIGQPHTSLTGFFTA